jgi:hypothetical protein
MAEIATEQTAARHPAKRIAAVLFVSISACATFISCVLSVRFLEAVNRIKGRLNSLEQLSPETYRKTLFPLAPHFTGGGPSVDSRTSRRERRRCARTIMCWNAGRADGIG